MKFEYLNHKAKAKPKPKPTSSKFTKQKAAKFNHKHQQQAEYLGSEFIQLSLISYKGIDKDLDKLIDNTIKSTNVKHLTTSSSGFVIKTDDVSLKVSIKRNEVLIKIL